MNILPKKSWHVRNKDNVARVRKDEAEAAEEERKRRKRAELAEQEARTDFLRKKARQSLAGPSCSDAVVASGEPAHVNFFQDVEEGGKGTNRGNKEYEEEKQKEKERQEKALGILTYLGQSASEAQTRPPWYQEAPTRSKDGEDSTKDEKLKGKLDPLCEMEKYLHRKTGEKKKCSEKKHKKTQKDERGGEGGKTVQGAAAAGTPEEGSGGEGARRSVVVREENPFRSRGGNGRPKEAVQLAVQSTGRPETQSTRGALETLGIKEIADRL